MKGFIKLSCVEPSDSVQHTTNEVPGMMLLCCVELYPPSNFVRINLVLGKTLREKMNHDMYM